MIRHCQRQSAIPSDLSEGVAFAPSEIEGGDAMDYTVLVLIVILYTIVAIKK